MRICGQPLSTSNCFDGSPNELTFVTKQSIRTVLRRFASSTMHFLHIAQRIPRERIEIRTATQKRSNQPPEPEREKVPAAVGHVCPSL
jgi:hypothetical protein